MNSCSLCCQKTFENCDSDNYSRFCVSSEEHTHIVLKQLLSSQVALQAQVEAQKLILEQQSQVLMRLHAHMSRPFITAKASSADSESNTGTVNDELFPHHLRPLPVKYASLHEVLLKLNEITGSEKQEVAGILHRHLLNASGLPPPHTLQFGSVDANTIRYLKTYLMNWATLLKEELSSTWNELVAFVSSHKITASDNLCFENQKTQGLPHFLRPYCTPENRFLSVAIAMHRILLFWECVIQSSFEMSIHEICLLSELLTQINETMGVVTQSTVYHTTISPAAEEMLEEMYQLNTRIYQQLAQGMNTQKKKI